MSDALERWLPRFRALATVVFIAALCLAVALLVIALVPGSPVTLALPTEDLSGTAGLGGTVHGVVVDRSGEIVFEVTDPSLWQRLLHLATTFPALLLVAEIARRMRNLLRAAEASDPFTAHTTGELTLLAKVTALGGLGVWLVGGAAKTALSATMLDNGATVAPLGSPLGWLAVGLIFAAFAQLVSRGVAMRAELDTVI